MTNVSTGPCDSAPVRNRAGPYVLRMTSSTPDSGYTQRHLALLGGVRLSGDWQVPPRLLHVAAVGGADVDVTQAAVPPVFTITKFSLVGGTRVRVPRDANVEVEGFAVVGRIRPVPAAEPSDRPAPTIRIRSYGVFGGVTVERG